MNTSASHPALTDLCLLIRDQFLGKWFATAPSSVQISERPSGHFCVLQFHAIGGVVIVKLQIRTNDDGSYTIRYLGGNHIAPRNENMLAHVPQSHPNFRCGFEHLDDAPSINN